jgi:membrane complex biogenesis BtpA family protein
MFGRGKALIGMIHIGPTPGGARTPVSIQQLAAVAAREAVILERAGFDGAIVENMHDAPYINAPHGPETVAAMTAAVISARRAAPGLTLGVQILSLGAKEAVAVALAGGAAFVRCENYVFAHVADEGLMPEAQAGPLLRYRRAIGAEHIRVYADIHKKHASHAITADLDVAAEATAAVFFGADGLVVTGQSTGRPTAPRDVAAAKRAAGDLPVLVGSGATEDQLPVLLEHADGVIVGSALKTTGVWDAPLDAERCRRFAGVFRRSPA